jgi:hypothetical protein
MRRDCRDRVGRRHASTILRLGGFARNSEKPVSARPRRCYNLRRASGMSRTGDFSDAIAAKKFTLEEA